MRQWNAFQEDRDFVLENLQAGNLDHVEVVSRVVETQFFQEFIGSGALAKLAETYPTPRRKEEVPLWVYLATQLTLRLHGAAGFASLPYILHCGGLRDALEKGQVERKRDVDSDQSYLDFKGYNAKNVYARRTPCDHDFVRKVSRDTRPDRLETWYGTTVASFLNTLKAYDSEGIFMVDGSYLFVPDNEHYEHSKVACFDEHNHPISKKDAEKLTPAQQKRCRFRRYYQLVSLSHTNLDSDFLLYAGARVVRTGGEVQQLVPLVDDFVESVGKGVMKLLIIDRGFIDGESISTIKKEHGVDVLIPLKAKMDITIDAWRLAEVDRTPWLIWEPPAKKPPADPPQRPEWIRRAEKKRQATIAKNKKDAGIDEKPRLVRVELKVIPRMKLWTECKVPLDVVVMREHMSDGTLSEWGLMTTREVDDPVEIRRLYGIRTACEEGWRQTKCYWDLTGFRSPCFSLVVNQIIFVLLAYTLLEVFLVKSDRGELAKATRKRLLAELLPDGEKVAIYFANHVGYFNVMEYTDIILNLGEGARRRLAGKIKRLCKSQIAPPALPERPTQ